MVATTDKQAAPSSTEVLKDRIFLFMETNKNYNYFLLCLIAISTLAFCMETMHELENYDTY